MTRLRVAVFGPSGMLGRWVVRELGADAVPIYARMLDLLNINSLRQALPPEINGIINCVGVIPSKTSIIPDMIQINSIFPHVLCELGIPTVLVSSDCVFSGRSRYRYTTNNTPDPRDYYGKTKALGEVVGQNVSVVRTSFIGCEHGFLKWVLDAGFVAKSTQTEVVIDGWKNALWSGSTVQVVARALIDILKDSEVHGLVHLSTEQVISKYDLATKAIEAYELNVSLTPKYEPIINRALQPTVVLQSLDEALEEYKCFSQGEVLSAV